MILVLDCKDGYEEFLNIVTEESFPICDIDAFLSSIIHTVFTPDESTEALMNDMVNGDLLFSINDLTPDERERIRYGVEVFIKLLQEKINNLKISLNREASFRYKGKQESGKIFLERVFTP